MDIVYATTSITLRIGHKSPFWHAPWLDGKNHIEIAPLIFPKSKIKIWKLCSTLKDDACVDKGDLDADFALEHLNQFVNLWYLLQEVDLNDEPQSHVFPCLACFVGALK
jgi:hypothetical protein